MLSCSWRSTRGVVVAAVLRELDVAVLVDSLGCVAVLEESPGSYGRSPVGVRELDVLEEESPGSDSRTSRGIFGGVADRGVCGSGGGSSRSASVAQSVLGMWSGGGGGGH